MKKNVSILSSKSAKKKLNHNFMPLWRILFINFFLLFLLEREKITNRWSNLFTNKRKLWVKDSKNLKINIKRFRLIHRNNNVYFLLLQQWHHNLILKTTNSLNNLNHFLRMKMILLSMMKIHLKIQKEIRL